MPILKTSLRFLFSTLCLGLWAAPEAGAVRPLSAKIALVAGEEGRSGYKDGSFNLALFNTPLGLAISDDGSRLFVADSGNNRIRIIHLDQDNEVTTLAGQDLAGKSDGPLAKAQFNHPSGLLTLPGDRLVVNDIGNELLRLVDLKAGTVTTLAGGPAAKVPMKGVRDMAYLSAAHSIFFTQPESGSLKRLDLGTGMVSTVLEHSAQLPHPAALWCQENKLYVADKDLPQVWEIDWKDNAAAKPLSLAAPLTQVLSLSVNDDILYALLGSPGVPAQRFFLNGKFNDRLNSQYDKKLVSFRSPWGDTIPPEALFPPQDQSFAPPIGFVPDPSDRRKFYVSKPECNMVVSFRDLFGFDLNPGAGDQNSNGVNEPEYPAQKPKNTYRILIVGDSRSIEIRDYPFPTDYHTQKRVGYYPHTLSLAPLMERELNFRAAMEGAPLNYEVFNLSRQGDLFLWPTYDVPGIVKRNDIDLVVIFMTRAVWDFMPYKFYFDHPLTSEGIPQYPNDMEYLVKPPLERIPKGAPKDLYDFCQAHGLVKIEGNVFNFDNKLISYPELHDSLVQLYGKPLDVLNRKLSGMKTSSGQPVRLLLCNTFTGRGWNNKPDLPLWVDAAKKFNFPLLDLNPDMDALHLSYFPLTSDNTHLDPDGFAFFARLLAHDLIRDKLIPWNRGPDH